MAPEFPPRLIAFSLDAAGNGLAATIENVEPMPPGSASRPLRVKWSELATPAGYRAVCGGALYVEEADGVLFTPPAPVQLESLEGDRYRWIQGTPPDVPWVMIAFVYPHGRSFRHARPAPTAAKSADGRIAAYWCLRGDDLGRTSVEWTLHPVRGPIDAEVRYLNSHSSLDSVPTASGIEMDTSADVPNRTIRVFLCHWSGDKDTVRALHTRLQAAGFAPWLDELDILPGEDWQRAITAAVRNSDVVLVCLSRGSVSTVGYLQREIRTALDVAEEQPEGAMFLIPLKLEPCDVPERLQRWQWLDYFAAGAHARLLSALRKRASQLASTGT
ncbi:MAG: toll/interleukin-1 receptor domain-containing protein [Vicinamibacterales bacterium]